MRASVMVFAAALLSAAACKPQSEAKSGDVDLSAANDAAARKAIADAYARFAPAVEKGDTAVMMSLYADDAVVMVANVPAWKGRAAISQAFGGMLKEVMVMGPKFVTDDVIVTDDIAVETGRYEWMIHPKDGGAAMTDKGKYITVWKRQADGSWKIIRDINNTDLPAK